MGRAPTGAHKRVVMTVPGVAGGDGQEGGLLGLAVSLRYRSDRLVYAYYTTNRDNRIVRFRLGGGVRPILTGLRRGAIHDGGRIASCASTRMAACRATTLSRARASGRTAIATCRGSPGTRAGGCGPPSSGRTASTRST